MSSSSLTHPLLPSRLRASSSVSSTRRPRAEQNDDGYFGRRSVDSARTPSKEKGKSRVKEEDLSTLLGVLPPMHPTHPTSLHLTSQETHLLSLPWSSLPSTSLAELFPPSPTLPSTPSLRPPNSPTTPRPPPTRRITHLPSFALEDPGSPGGGREEPLFPPSPPRGSFLDQETSQVEEGGREGGVTGEVMGPYEALKVLGVLSTRLLDALRDLEAENHRLREELHRPPNGIDELPEKDTDQISVHDSLTEALSTTLHSPHPSYSSSHSQFATVRPSNSPSRPGLSSSPSTSSFSLYSGRTRSIRKSESTTPTSSTGAVPLPGGKRTSWTGLFSWSTPPTARSKRESLLPPTREGWGKAEPVVGVAGEVEVEEGRRRRRSGGAVGEEDEDDEDGEGGIGGGGVGNGGSSPAFRAIFQATRILTPDPSSVLLHPLPPSSLIAYLAHTLISTALENGIYASEPRSRRTSISARSFDSTHRGAGTGGGGGGITGGLGQAGLEGLQGALGSLKDVWRGKVQPDLPPPKPDARKSLLRSLSTRQFPPPSPPSHPPGPSSTSQKPTSPPATPTPAPAVELASIIHKSDKPPTMLIRRGALEDYLGHGKEEEGAGVATNFGELGEEGLSGYTDRYGFVYDLKHAKALLAEQKNLQSHLQGDKRAPEWQTIKRKPVTSPPLAAPQQHSKPGSSRNSISSSSGDRRGSDSASSILSASKAVAAPISPSLTLDTASRVEGSTGMKRARSTTISSIGPTSPSKPTVSNQEVTVSSSGAVDLAPVRDAGPFKTYSGTIRTRVAKLDDLVPNNRKPVSALLSQLTETHDKEEVGRLKQWQSFLKHHGKSQSTSLLPPSDESQYSSDLLGLAQLGHSKHATEERRALNRLVRTVGIPIELRGQVWAEFSGAREEMVPGEYREILEVHKGDENPVLGEIEKDVGRTFASNVFFGGDGVGCQKLRRLLTAYAWHDPSIGYCQGMNLLAATLLLTYPSEEQAYWTFISLISTLLPPLYFSPSLLGSRVEQAVLEEFVEELLPRVWRKFGELGMGLSAVSFGWMLSLFTNCLPIETLFRVWDILFAEGSDVIIRTALAILKLGSKSLLLCTSVPELFELLNGLTERLWVADKLLVVQNKLKKDITHESIVKKRAKHLRIMTAEEESGGSA